MNLQNGDNYKLVNVSIRNDKNQQKTVSIRLCSLKCIKKYERELNF